MINENDVGKRVRLKSKYSGFMIEGALNYYGLPDGPFITPGTKKLGSLKDPLFFYSNGEQMGKEEGCGYYIFYPDEFVSCEVVNT